MLRQFKYLNAAQLDQYIAQVEDGLRQSLTRSQGGSSGRGAGLNLKVAQGSLTSNLESNITEELADAGAAKFERLTQLVSGNEEAFGWVEVLQEADLQVVKTGSIVDLSADLFAPDVSKLAGAGGFLEMLPLARLIAKMSPGSDSLSGLPGAEQLDAMEAFMKAMPASLIQGEIVDLDWTIVGQLSGPPADVEGEARVVGKVIRRWDAGSWKPLPGLPIVSQLPREQRREYERKGPADPSQKMMWIEGPAIELDILAIYR